jgi:multiple sugar transport system substrate-binding protein
MRKILMVLLMVVLATSLFTGCAPEKQAVKFWWALGEGEPYYKQNKDFVDKFNKDNTKILVQPESMSWNDIRDKVVIAGKAKNPPEMVESIPEWITEYYQLGLLQDLTGWVNQYPEKNKVYPVAWESLTYDGKIIGIPEYFGIRALMYHEDMFKKAGIKEPPKTWKDFLEAGRKLTKDGVYGFGFCGQSVRSPQEFIVYLWQNGVDIVTKMPDGKYKNTWNDNPAELDAAAEVLQFYYDMIYTYKITPETAVSWGYNEMDTAFASGKVAMAVDGPWMQAYENQYPEVMKDVKITQIPYSKQPATFLEVLAVVLFKDAKNPKAAWDFGKEILSYDYQTTANRGQPIRTDISVAGNKWVEGFMNLVPTGKFIPHVAFGKIGKIMIDTLQSVLLKQKSPRDAAQWMGVEINKSLE